MPYSVQDKTNDIKEIQEYLRTISNYNTNIPKIAVNGILDNDTLNAIKLFKKEYGLNPDGKINNEAWDKIVEEYQRILSERVIPNSIRPFPAAGFSLSEGDSGNIVYIIQIMLNSIADDYFNMKHSPIDGSYNAQTTDAVRFFQQLSGMAQTGTVDLSTWNALADVYNLR